MKKLITILFFAALSIGAMAQFRARTGISAGDHKVSGTNIEVVDSLTKTDDGEYAIYMDGDTIPPYTPFANRIPGGTLYPELADTTYSTCYGGGTGQPADSTLFAEEATAFGVWTVKVDTAYIVNIDNQRFSAGDSAKFNVYIGNSMTMVATDSLFTAPQGVGDNRVVFTPNKTRKIPKGKDVWVGLMGDQITGMRPNLWYLQLNWYIIKAD